MARLGVGACLLLAIATASPAEVVKLDAEAAAARAVAVSHVAAAAQARTEEAQTGVDAAEAARLPTLAATAVVTRRSAVPEFAAAINGPLQPPVVLFPNIETAYVAGLTATQLLYGGGAVAAGREAALRALAGSRAGVRASTADVRLAARIAYWSAVRSQASLAAARANEERAQRLHEDTKALLANGMAVRADVLAAEETLATASLYVIRAETATAEALAELRSLLQLAGDDRIELEAPLAGLPAPGGRLAELQRDAQAQRPDLAASAARLAAVDARERLARAPTLPSLTLAAAWDLARPNQRYFPLEDDWNDSWSVGVAASWTLFDGGKARADVAGAEAGRRALAAEHEELSRRIALEVENAARELASALAAVTAADAARAAAEERERASKERHQEGLATTSEILDAETALAAAEQRQIDAHASAWVAAARLERAVGK